jgi:hypothetical protein
LISILEALKEELIEFSKLNFKSTPFIGNGLFVTNG